MKTLFTTGALMLAISTSFAQTEGIQKVYDHYPEFDEYQIDRLLAYPNDPSRIIVGSSYVAGNGPEFKLSEFDGQNYQEMEFGGVESLTTAGFEVDGGVLFGAATSYIGEELMFYNGSQTFGFDLNPGLEDSSPKVYTVGGRGYATAYNGSHVDIYHVVNQTQITKISNSQDAIEEAYVVGHTDSKIFYAQRNMDALNQIHWKLWSADYFGIGNPSGHTLLKDVVLGENYQGYGFAWSNVIEKWGAVYLIEKANSDVLSGGETGGILKIDNMNNVEVLLEEQYGSTYFAGVNFVEVGDELFYAVNGTDQLFKSDDGESFSVEYEEPGLQVDGGFFYFKNINEELFFVHRSTEIGEDKVVQLDNGSLTTMVEGYHLHDVYENSESIYYLDFLEVEGGENQLIRLNKTTGNSDSFTIPTINNALHPTIEMGTLEFNGKITFLFPDVSEGSVSTGLTNDIYELTDVLSIHDGMISEFVMYPNPIQKEDVLTIHSFVHQEGVVINMKGNVCLNVTLNEGENQLNISTLGSGMYFLKVGNESKKLIIE